MSLVSPTIRQQVISEAQQCCEYCQTQQCLIGMPLVIDHIIPLSLGGSSERANLAASCYRCNEFKGAKTQGIDPQTGETVTLFHPRQLVWAEHFTWSEEGTQIK
jgi:5-methylcytosine-specific restriction endonuclease McrA